ncbi:MAG: DUF4340 domain-containing protein [Candidatus Omnitrophota bacterium]
MKTKQIIILSIILGALAFGILLKSWVRSVEDKAGTARRGRTTLAEFDPTKLEKILIGRGSQSPAVELAKENGVWKVKNLWNAKADSVKVENLIQGLRSVQGELRGSGKKLFADFGIQDTDAFSIKLFGGGNTLLLDLRLGTKQAGENAYFIRKVTIENVYLVEMNMAELLGIYGALNEATPAGLFWTDLRLFNLDPEKVTKIDIYLLKGEEKTMITGLERETGPQDPSKSSWKFLHTARASSPDPDKVLKFIATMNNIRAQEVVDPGGKAYGLEKPVWQLAVTENGKEMLLNAGSKNEKEGFFYVKRSGDPTVFDLKASFFDDLNVDDTHFAKDIPPIVRPKKNSSQNINAGLPGNQRQAA